MKRREVKTCKHWQDESLHGFLGKWHSCISSSAEFLQQHPASVCFPVWLLAAVGGVCVQPQGKRGYFTLLSASQHSFSWERWVQASKHVYPRFWGGIFIIELSIISILIDYINYYRLLYCIELYIYYRVLQEKVSTSWAVVENTVSWTAWQLACIFLRWNALILTKVAFFFFFTTIYLRRQYLLLAESHSRI